MSIKFHLLKCIQYHIALITNSAKYKLRKTSIKKIRTGFNVNKLDCECMWKL